MHRWVLMQEAGGGDGGAAGSGGAASGSAGADGAASTGVAAGGASGVSGTGTAAAAAEGAQSGQAAGAANADGAAKPGVDLEALKPPTALTDGGEAKAEDGKEAPKDGEPKPDDKPVEYTDFTLPEGIAIEAEKLAAFKEAAAGAKLSQEQAQKFVDLHTQAITEASTKPYEMWRDTQKQWQDQIKADPEFGGAKLESETLPAIARAIREFSPNDDAAKALKQAFSFTGAGNNPEVIRFIARIGKSLAEGTHVSGKPAGGDGGKSAASKLYPSAGGNAQS